jgi:hypothetical protein
MPINPDVEAARTELHRTIMAALSNVLHGSQLPPMTAMKLAAATIGSIYKEMADEHRSSVCPCGWYPYPSADLEALQTALAAATEAIPLSDLRTIQVAGRA